MRPSMHTSATLRATVAAAAVALLIAGIGPLHGCDGGGDSKKQIDIIYINWTEDVAMSNLLAVLLKEELGYEVDLTMADVAPAYTSVAAGSQDLFLDAWLPNTHAPYWERYGDRLVDLGKLYEEARIGLVVPADAPGQSIGDLAQHRSAYGSEIVGIDAGAGIMRRSEEVLEAYHLEGYELMAASEPAMTAALRDAIEEGRPIVVTGWRPHWKFARWDLRFLEDPQHVYGEIEHIHAIARQGFEKDHPRVAAIVRNMRFTDEQLVSLINATRRTGVAPRDAAREWLQQHEQLVEQWLEPVSSPASIRDNGGT